MACIASSQPTFFHHMFIYIYWCFFIFGFNIKPFFVTRWFTWNNGMSPIEHFTTSKPQKLQSMLLNYENFDEGWISKLKFLETLRREDRKQRLQPSRNHVHVFLLHPSWYCKLLISWPILNNDDALFPHSLSSLLFFLITLISFPFFLCFDNLLSDKKLGKAYWWSQLGTVNKPD